MSATPDDHRFTAAIEKDGSYPTYVSVPDSVAVFGTGMPVKVTGTADGEPFEATLMPSGAGGHWLPLRQEICRATGKDAAGQTVDIAIRRRTA